MNFIESTKVFKNNLLKKENIINFIIILTVFSLDRISKFKVLNDFSDKDYFINNFLNIDLIWNIGIGFGFLSTTSAIIYNLITVLILSIIVFLFISMIKAEYLDKIIYSTIIGGALGNFYDRVIFMAVPDFIDLHFNNFHWFVFNVADIFISLGIIVFIIRSYLLSK